MNLTPYTSLPSRDLDPSAEEEALLSRIPLFDDPRKTEYLGYRGVGFNHEETLKLLDLRDGTVQTWTEKDPDFKLWATEKFRELQKNVGKDILRLQFARNMHLAMRIHSNVLNRFAFDIDNATDVDLELLKHFSRIYTPEAFSAMLRATSLLEANGLDDRPAQPNVNIHVQGDMIVDDAARRAASRQILHQFREKPVDIIEGEIVDNSPSS